MIPPPLLRSGPWLAAVLAGLTLAAAFPPEPRPWLVPIALAAVLASLRRASPWTWGLSGVLVAAGWFHVVPRAVAGHWGVGPALVMYLWLCFAVGLVFLSAGGISKGWPPARRVYALALVWPASSWALEHLARTPILLAPAWVDAPTWLASTRWIGAVGFDAAVWTLAGALVATFAARRPATPGVLALGLLAGASFGPAPEVGEPFAVAGLQPAVASRDFERATQSLFERRRIERRLDAMTQAALDAGPDLVVWPEGGNELANEQLPRRQARLRDLTRTPDAALLTGSRAIGPRGRVANTATLWQEGRPRARVLKANPVPFAEARLVAGAPGTVRVSDATVGVAICFDALFGGHARALRAAGAEAIVVTSDDASLVDPALPAWHAAYARVRAIEVGRPLLFVSNLGPSFAMEADGRVVEGLAPGLRGRFEATVHRARGGVSSLGGIVAALSLGLAAFLGRRRRPSGGLRRSRGSTGLAVVALVAFVGTAGAQVSLRRVERRPPRDDLSALFHQSTQRSCGAAALAHALTFLGDEVFEQDILRRSPHAHPEGYSMAELKRIAASRGFTATGWAANLEDLEHLGGGVALALLEVGHFVVVLSVDSDGALVFDPALGQTLRVPRPELERVYSSRALYLVPGSAEVDAGSDVLSPPRAERLDRR